MRPTVHRFQKNVNVLKSPYDGPRDDPPARPGAPLRGRGPRLRGAARVGPDRRRDGPAPRPGLRRDAGRRGRPDDVRGAGRRRSRSVPPRSPERCATSPRSSSSTVSASPGRAATSTSSGRTPGTTPSSTCVARMRRSRRRSPQASTPSAGPRPRQGSGSRLGRLPRLHRRRDDRHRAALGGAPQDPPLLLTRRTSRRAAMVDMASWAGFRGPAVELSCGQPGRRRRRRPRLSRWIRVALAPTRLGGVARWGALRRMCSGRRLRRALRDGRIVRGYYGRYALPHADAARAAGSRLTGYVSHTSAALHWGWAVKSAPTLPHVTVSRHRKTSLRPGRLTGWSCTGATWAPTRWWRAG